MRKSLIQSPKFALNNNFQLYMKEGEEIQKNFTYLWEEESKSKVFNINNESFILRFDKFHIGFYELSMLTQLNNQISDPTQLFQAKLLIQVHKCLKTDPNLNFCRKYDCIQIIYLIEQNCTIINVTKEVPFPC